MGGNEEHVSYICHQYPQGSRDRGSKTGDRITCHRLQSKYLYRMLMVGLLLQSEALIYSTNAYLPELFGKIATNALLHRFQLLGKVVIILTNY